MTPAVELAFLKDRNFAIVPATIEGTLVSMMVDTGSETTLVTPDAAQRLRLRPDAVRRSLLRGVGGTVISRNALLQQFALGGLVVRNHSFSVGALPAHFIAQPPVAGLLGADVLAAFDIDFDVPHGRMALYRVGGCGPDMLDEELATDNNAALVPLRQTAAGRLIMTIEVDGQT